MRLLHSCTVACILLSYISGAVSAAAAAAAVVMFARSRLTRQALNSFLPFTASPSLFLSPLSLVSPFDVVTKRLLLTALLANFHILLPLLQVKHVVLSPVVVVVFT